MTIQSVENISNVVRATQLVFFGDIGLYQCLQPYRPTLLSLPMSPINLCKWVS